LQKPALVIAYQRSSADDQPHCTAAAAPPPFWHGDTSPLWEPSPSHTILV